MKHRTKDEAPIVRQIRQAQSVSANHHVNARGNVLSIAITDTTTIVANDLDGNCRGRGAVQGA